MLSIQPFAYTDGDYQAIAAIEGGVFNTSPLSLDEWKHTDHSRSPEYLFQRDLIRRGNEVIAYGEYGQNRWAYHPQKYFVTIYADPARDAADIRPAYLARVLEALSGKDLIAITSGMLDDKPEAMRFFADYGFHEVAREQLSALDVSAFDASRFASVLERVRTAGIEIVTLRDLQGYSGDWQQKLYDLDTTISRDIPSTGEKHRHTFESWCAARLDGPAFDPDGWFVALDGDRYVGESQGSISDIDPGQFLTSVTGVRREYRHQGIATALKLHAITYAQRRGVKEIMTTNDSRNPMVQLNLLLGFRLLPAWVRVEKPL